MIGYMTARQGLYLFEEKTPPWPTAITRSPEPSNPGRRWWWNPARATPSRRSNINDTFSSRLTRDSHLDRRATLHPTCPRLAPSFRPDPSLGLRQSIEGQAMTIIGDFVSRVQRIAKTGAATEHSYRPALEALFNALAEGVTALNEPKRVACGAPDFIIQRGDIIIGHAEAKDLGIGIRALKAYPSESGLSRYGV